MKLKFLGTGGGRYATASQKRKTGGILVKTEQTQIHIDPGPGALYHTQRMANKPENTEAVILSHGHMDHYTDIEPIIEMMTHKYGHPGTIYANNTALEGSGKMEKSISNYHKDLCRDVKMLEEGEIFNFKDLRIESQLMKHSEPNTQGLVLETDQKRIGFWVDTEYSKDLTEFYEDCDIVVINCNRPIGSKSFMHTTIEDIPKIVEQLDAKTYILTHFNLDVLEELKEQKEYIEENVDEKVIFAEDGMEFPGNKSLGDF